MNRRNVSEILLALTLLCMPLLALSDVASGAAKVDTLIEQGYFQEALNEVQSKLNAGVLSDVEVGRHLTTPRPPRMGSRGKRAGLAWDLRDTI